MSVIWIDPRLENVKSYMSNEHLEYASSFKPKKVFKTLETDLVSHPFFVNYADRRDCTIPFFILTHPMLEKFSKSSRGKKFYKTLRHYINLVNCLESSTSTLQLINYGLLLLASKNFDHDKKDLKRANEFYNYFNSKTSHMYSYERLIPYHETVKHDALMMMLRRMDTNHLNLSVSDLYLIAKFFQEAPNKKLTEDLPFDWIVDLVSDDYYLLTTFNQSTSLKDFSTKINLKIC